MFKFVLVAAVLAVLVYLLVRIIERRGLTPRSRPAPRPIAPDDDPDFLWGLDKKKRHPEDDEGPDDKT